MSRKHHTSQSQRARFTRIHRESHYEVLDIHNRIHSKEHKVEITLPVATRKMIQRGFSTQAIEEDFDILGITPLFDIQEFAAKVAVSPPSRFH